MAATHDFGRLPANARSTPTPFKVEVPDSKLIELKSLIAAGKVGPTTYEGLQADRRYGIDDKWLQEAKEAWLEFDWREVEAEINVFSHYKASVSHAGQDFDIHFIALFSERDDAVPILMLHGWPGSFMEFVPIFRLLKQKYTPTDLPYHIIVPSLPGLQGGDVGSKVARVLGGIHPRAKAIHLNFCIMSDPGNFTPDQYTAAEKQGLLRAQEFARKGSAYALEHATRPSTIALVLASNPIALLAWVGEKMLEWTDTPLPLLTILADVTLYWLTDSISTSLWPYRQLFTPGNVGAHENPEWFIRKPMGFSWFPKEIAPVPRRWVETTRDAVFYREHESGGHFAALEVPEVLLGDLEEFVGVVRGRGVI
ncbi:hypothetical protein M409DRAFT_61817 [Zasmidium cellare ATCC 36951]|uniref:Epoxide hydrolase N-terminal domain-containing protein n=1 Tax=Zasmidium cellare ATCC 36951 TaxID=1080233 RepID=A0A6A6D1S6_ZASCE|nr:uncharacterized protein M409DRAFT_61817 [Zasmidium cellare ATCC 36951]KAF2173377.1 hypothetical protein M409DRAFT_61817 [Zasmidium cellare ATCC 36951]